MSFEAMKWATEQKLPAMQKIVLLMLANRADKDYSCYPTHETLAVDCGMDKRSVVRNIEKLEHDGYIKIKKSHRKNNIYTLIIGDTESLNRVTESHLKDSRVTQSHSQGDTESLNRVTESHSNQSYKPIIEPSSFFSLSDSEKNEKLSEEMQGCYDWAVQQTWWKERITDINKFLHFYSSNSANGLKAQFLQAQKNREVTTNNTHGSLTNKNQGANYVTRTKTKQPDYSNPEYYRGTDASF